MRNEYVLWEVGPRRVWHMAKEISEKPGKKKKKRAVFVLGRRNVA